MKVWYVVCYDISEDRRRRGIEKVCRKYMQRIQYSVFEGYLGKDNYVRLYQALNDETQKAGFDRKSDSILILKQCAVCRVDQVIMGKETGNGEQYLIV